MDDSPRARGRRRFRGRAVLDATRKTAYRVSARDGLSQHHSCDDLSTGTVAPENRLDLKPPVAGRVEKVLVQEGDIVRKGQILGMDESHRTRDLDRYRPITGKSRSGLLGRRLQNDADPGAESVASLFLKSADSGQTVTQTDIVLSMSDRLIVKVNVDETDLAQIKRDSGFKSCSMPLPQSHSPGKVVHIGYDAKTINNVTTYEVDVLADNTPEYMKSGMTANATFLVAEQD